MSLHACMTHESSLYKATELCNICLNFVVRLLATMIEARLLLAVVIGILCMVHTPSAQNVG